MNILKKAFSFITGKAYSTTEHDLDQFTGNINFFGYTAIHILPRRAYELSDKCGPLGDAVGRISDSISALVIGIKDEDGELEFKNDLVRLLNNPGEGYSGSQFRRELAESFLLTQEAWIIARGIITSPALAITFMRPYDVDVLLSTTDGLPTEVRTNCNRDRKTYKRTMINGKMRFIDQIGMNEIIPIIGAVSMLDHWRGRSKLNQVVYDIAMSTDGKRHNVSLLKNGLRTSGILSPRTDTTGSNKWDDKKVKALEQNIRNFHQGSENAGNILILGAPAQIDGITQNNKDMDFIALLKESKVEIYNAFKIPLPLVLSESMTYDNLTTSQRAYYDKAVFPVFNMLADGIMSGLGERYGLEENEKLSFSVLAIRDLQSVLAEDMTQLKNTEVVRVNEIRAIGGLKPDMDGDVILVGAGKLPLQAVSIGPLPEESNPTPYKPTETVPPEDNMDDETEDDTTD